MTSQNMEKFKEIKSEILRRGYEAGACCRIERAEDSESMEELAQVIKDNFAWCVYKKVLDTKIICKYRKDFASLGIYANRSCSDGYVVIDNKANRIFGNAIAILCGNAIVNDVYDNATVIRVYDIATIRRVYDNATVIGVCDSATVNEVGGLATVIVVRGNATVDEVFDNATIKNVCGRATVNEVRDNAYISVCSYIKCKINGHAIMRVRNENKIYTNTEVEIPNNN